MRKKKVKVYFDGNCNVCSREIQFYKKIDRNEKFEWIDIHSDHKDIDTLGISKNKLLKILHVKTSSLEIKKGVDAFICIWSELRFFRFISIIIRLSPIKKFLNFLYIRWADHRFRKLKYKK